MNLLIHFWDNMDIIRGMFQDEKSHDYREFNRGFKLLLQKRTDMVEELVNLIIDNYQYWQHDDLTSQIVRDAEYTFEDYDIECEIRVRSLRLFFKWLKQPFMRFKR